MLNGKGLEEWDKVLIEIMFAYNTSVETTSRFTPYFHMFGVEARFPREILIGFPKMECTPAG